MLRYYRSEGRKRNINRLDHDRDQEINEKRARQQGEPDRLLRDPPAADCLLMLALRRRFDRSALDTHLFPVHQTPFMTKATRKIKRQPGLSMATAGARRPSRLYRKCRRSAPF